jgi:putative oxidoreductase
MRKNKYVALAVLRLTLGMVILIQSFLFLYGGESAAFFARYGLPDAVRLILGWSEVVAAVLFLVPITTVVGAWLLLVVFAGAILLHILLGQYEVGGLLVYSAAVYVVLAFRDSRRLRIDENVSRG